MRKLIMILVGVLLLAVMGSCQATFDVSALIRGAYPKLVLLGFEKGQFTGSKNDEYLAFYEDPRERLEEDSPKVIAKYAVFVFKNNKVTSQYDLDKIDVWTLEYKRELYINIIKNPQLEFGRWAGYAYIGDYNGNGLEEILFFQLTGRYFLPMIVEYNGKEFEITLEFDTPREMLSEIRTEARNGRKLLKIYGSGGGDIPEGKRDWYLYEWNGKSKHYEIVENGME